MRGIWSNSDLDYLKEHYPNSTAQEIATYLSRTKQSVYSKARDLKLKKSEAFLESEKSGRLNGSQGFDTRFKKGSVSWNKGKKVDVGGRSIETRFKKGNIPHNHQPIGSTRMKEGYLQVKISVQNKWEFVHRLEYEKHFGLIPKDSIVVFRNGDKTQINKENLKCITRKEAVAKTRKTKGYAAYLLEKDIEKRAFILDCYPELIYIKQLQLELNQSIKSHE